MPISALAGVASGLASAYMQQQFTKENADRDAEIQRGMQAQNFMYADEMQRRAPVNTKLGMMAAGLNPNSMNTSSSAGSVPSAPLGNHAAPDINFAADTNAIADSRLKNAEAKRVELENENTEHANESSLENYLNQVRSIVHSYRERGWQDQADILQEELDNLERLKESGNLNWNLGDLRGAVEAFGAVDKMQERLTQQIGKIFETEKNYHLLVNNRAVDVAALPPLERELMSKQIGLSAAQTALTASQEKVNDEQIKNISAETDKLRKEIDYLEEQGKLTKAQAEQIRNADWKSLFKDGRLMAGSVAFLDDYTKEILHVLGGLANAFVGLKTGGAIAKGLSEKKKVIYHEFEKPAGNYNGHSPMKRSMLGDGVPDDNYNDD